MSIRIAQDREKDLSKSGGIQVPWRGVVLPVVVKFGKEDSIRVTCRGITITLVKNKNQEELVRRAKSIFYAEAYKALRNQVRKEVKHYTSLLSAHAPIPKVTAHVDGVNGEGPQYLRLGKRCCWALYYPELKHISVASFLSTVAPRFVSLIVAHELCHVVYLHHGPKFWSLLSKVYTRPKVAHTLLSEMRLPSRHITGAIKRAVAVAK